MRYRKNRKFSGSLFPAGYELHPHHCLLNQSPWDAIPFSSDSDFQSYLLQFGRDSRLNNRDASTSNVPSVEREPEAAIHKKVDANGYTERIIVEEKDEIGMKEHCEKIEIEENGLRPRSQRRAAKKARWLNSNTNEFYYYSDFGRQRRWNSSAMD